QSDHDRGRFSGRSQLGGVRATQRSGCNNNDCPIVSQITAVARASSPWRRQSDLDHRPDADATTVYKKGQVAFGGLAFSNVGNPSFGLRQTIHLLWFFQRTSRPSITAAEFFARCCFACGGSRSQLRCRKKDPIPTLLPY